MMYTMNLGQILTHIGSTHDLERVVRLNRQYAQSLGWQAHFDRIVQMLGFAFHTPGDSEFAEAVAEWQARQTDTKAAQSCNGS